MGSYCIIDVVCLGIMGILYFQAMRSVHKNEKRDRYMNILISGILYNILDLCWGIIYEGLFPIPIPIQKGIYALFYASSAILSYQWFIFVEYVQDSIFYRNATVRKLVKIPMLFVIVMSIFSIWTKAFFYIGESGEYIRGSWYVVQLFLSYGYILFAVAKVLLFMLITKEVEIRNNYVIILSYFIVPIIFGVLQISDPSKPYLCMGIMIASLQSYLFVVKFEQERALNTSKIYGLTQIFINSYYLDLKTGVWEYLSIPEEKNNFRLKYEYYKKAPKNYEEALRTYAKKYVHKDDREKYLTMCRENYVKEQLSKEYKSYSFTYRQIAGEKEKWYRMHVIAASFAENGKATKVVFALMDIDAQVTANLQHQQMLEDALIQAENANKAKSTFLSNMSHDIRTPMNAIIGFTNLAQKRSKDKEMVDEYLEKIMSASKHLLDLINDILDMSRIESGKIQIEEDEISLADIVKEMNTLIQPMAADRNISFKIKTSITDNYVYCDKLRLNQVLINLLSNSIKFTPQGGQIYFHIKQAKSSDTKKYGTYIFKIKDNGVGMSQEFLQKIFQPFEREKVMDTSGVQGTGLGLSIVKSIVDMMGGEISVNSELGKGSEFIVKVVFRIHEKESFMISREEFEKQNQIEETQKTEQTKNMFVGKKILLVDDNEINREIAIEILTSEGFDVVEAENGKEAVEIVKNAKPDEFAVVLMDVQMPIMDGYQATKAIRELSDTALAEVPIIAMTANAFDEDKKRAFKSGMNGHIAKPIEIDVLFATLNQILK